MHTIAVRAALIAGILFLTGACASSDDWAMWRSHSTHFASGEHGDIFAFVVKTEGLTFPEAVEQLAQEAGVPMPEAGPRDVQAEDARARLYALVAAAAAYFETQLAAASGQDLGWPFFSNCSWTGR